MSHRIPDKRYRRLIKCPDTGEAVWSYEEYLNTEHWQLLREGYFERHDRKCGGCGTADGAIQLHHLTYSRIGNEDDKDLTPLCIACHHIVEDIKRGNDPCVRKKRMTSDDKLEAARKKKIKKKRRQRDRIKAYRAKVNTKRKKKRNRKAGKNLNFPKE